MNVPALTATLAGFVSGSIMYSYLIPRMICGKDVRLSAADHNPGAANAGLTCGKGVGILCGVNRDTYTVDGKPLILIACRFLHMTLYGEGSALFACEQMLLCKVDIAVINRPFNSLVQLCVTLYTGNCKLVLKS